ncbi:MAG: hypothetical protein QOI81_1719 [Actinomycetota bacterium]|nr:hypothetical protein [Actinomycetota bacterium]
MTDRNAGRLAWAIALVCFTMAGVSLIFWVTTRAIPEAANGNGSGLSNIVPAMTFGALGALVASRQPRNRIGWLMLVIAVGTGLTAIGFYVAKHALAAGASPTGWVRWAAWSGNWTSGFAIGSLILVFLLFPSGRPLSRRWGWVGWTTVAVGTAFSLGLALDTSPIAISPRFPKLHNPVGIGAATGFNNSPVFLVIVILLLVGAVGLLVRLRRSMGDERQQLKWFVYATGVSVGVMVVAIPITAVSQSLSNTMFNLAFNLGFAFLVPAAAALSILRYGLYEIDVVINKTLVYGLLAAFLTAVYVAVVVGVGAIIGSTHNTLLTLVAAALIALAFNPVRERAKRLANRLVYGERATPYEVLSEFSGQMAGTYALDDILPRMARVLAEGTAGIAEIWLRENNVLHAVAIWPDDEGVGPSPAPLAVSGNDVPVVPEASAVSPVTHQGELLGAITVAKPLNDPLRPTESKLIEDVAAQAGLVLRNVRLIQDLRASRQRLVQAQDEERRRLERNIHDGAQQQLVALAVKGRLAAGLLDRDLDKARELLVQIQTETAEALEDLRDLARGIYPPLLADKGLAAALEAQARRSAIPVTIESGEIERYPREAEAAVYFCCLEALQNIAKYAEAGTATVRLSNGADWLSFEVSDDGQGFDPASTGYGTGLRGMADRLEALGGSLDVRSAPGAGTTVVGRVPGG